MSDSQTDGLLHRLRDAGWRVAVHNNYMLCGVLHTFWGFSRDNQFVKGEGTSDQEALSNVEAAILALSAAESSVTSDSNVMTHRDAIARAHGWASWHQVIEVSQRDGYTENGGRGPLAAAIARKAAYAERLIELVDTYGAPPCHRCGGSGQIVLGDRQEPCLLCAVRHVGCVVRESSTCMWLADNTKISVRREPTTTGRTWLEHVPTPVLRTQGSESEEP